MGIATGENLYTPSLCRFSLQYRSTVSTDSDSLSQPESSQPAPTQPGSSQPESSQPAERIHYTSQLKLQLIRLCIENGEHFSGG